MRTLLPVSRLMVALNSTTLHKHGIAALYTASATLLEEERFNVPFASTEGASPPQLLRL
jgi:hypothetical protein